MFGTKKKWDAEKHYLKKKDRKKERKERKEKENGRFDLSL